MTAKKENVQWLDGLRGVASFLVVVSHLNRAFNEQLFRPTNEEGAAPHILQYPIIRAFVQGRTTIPVFALVTGYVCALKPTRQFPAGDQDKALKGITRSAFRRTPRLILPAWFATCLVWIFTQCGVFLLTKHVSSFWLIMTSPTQLPIGEGITNLIRSLITTFTRGTNAYDPHQWTMLPLLKGAYIVFSFLYATAYMKSRYRMMLAVAMVGYYYEANDPTFGLSFFFGVFLAEISQSPAHLEWLSLRKWPGRFLSPILLLVGLIFASYPEEKPEWMPWSNFMHNMSEYMLLPKFGSPPQYFSGLGVILIALSIHFSKSLQYLLSSKYLLWCGKNSFAVYLLHGALIKSVLTWMMFGIVPPPDIVKPDGSTESGPNLPRPTALRWYAFLPIWFALLYYVANLWTSHVDPACGKITAALERKLFQEETEKASTVSLLPQ